MSDKLRDSFFLRDRVVNFTAALLRGADLSPITEFEKKLLANADKLRELDQAIDGKLVTLLGDAKDYVPPHTALRVMLHLHSLGYTNQAHQLIYFAGRDRQSLSDEEVTELVNEIKRDPSVQIEWYVTLLNTGETPEENTPYPRSGLDLPLDFK